MAVGAAEAWPDVPLEALAVPHEALGEARHPHREFFDVDGGRTPTARAVRVA